MSDMPPVQTGQPLLRQVLASMKLWVGPHTSMFRASTLWSAFAETITQ